MPLYTDKFTSIISGGVSKSNKEVSDPGFVESIAKLSFAHNCFEATVRLHFTGEHKEQLAQIGTLVEGFQNSPCTFGLNVGDFQAQTIIPFPFDQSLSRIRIARKSGWVEVVVPFTINSKDPSFNFPLFPVLKGNSGNYYAWNLPQLSTDLLPMLNLDTPHNLSWIHKNLSGSYSVRQTTVREKGLKGITTGDDLVDLIMNIVTHFRPSSGTAGSPNREGRLFCLEMEGSVVAIIFVMGFRLEQCDNTAVVDSCVLLWFLNLWKGFQQSCLSFDEERVGRVSVVR
jgi:hypothetical protein